MIKFPGTVIKATFLRRYKRFFADILLDDGQTVVAHTPNTGTMKSIADEGNRCLISYTPSPTRKLAYTLQALQVGKNWVGCNTSIPNHLIFSAIVEGKIPELSDYNQIKREVVYGKSKRSRIDIFLSQHKEFPDAFIEIKNVTLKENDQALFPDAVTSRGLKHLLELEEQVSLGFRAVMLFLIQRTDCLTFSPAAEIDPEYARTLRSVHKKGVEIICLTASLSPSGVTLGTKLPLQL